MKKSNVAFLGLYTAFAMILSFVESQIPMVIPGIKLGLPNIAIIVILYKFGTKEALIVSLIRVLLTAFLFTDPQMILYGVAGATLSFIVMVLLKGKLNIVTVSILGGICHNIGQTIVACIMTSTSQILYTLPILLVSGVVAGTMIGLVSTGTYKKIEKIEF